MTSGHKDRGWTLLHPGSLELNSGGTRYDRQMVLGARSQGQPVRCIELEGSFPFPSPREREAAERALGGLEDGTLLVADGLALGALPGEIARHARRLTVAALVHHPLRDESGLRAKQAAMLERSEREALGHAAGLIATSSFTAERLRELGMLQGSTTVCVVEPGVTAAKSRPLPAPDAPLEILTVGAVTTRKAHLDGLRALEAVPAGARPWRWTVAGRLDQDPAQAARFRRAIEVSSVRTRVRILGEVSDPELDRLFAQSDLLLHPSHYEGYGMVITEALARALPVVTTTGGALAMTLPQDAGIQVAPGDVPAMALALEELLQTQGPVASHAPGSSTLGQLKGGAERARAGLRTWREARAEFMAFLDGLR